MADMDTISNMRLAMRKFGELLGEERCGLDLENRYSEVSLVPKGTFS
ncbi:MAG: hypothetical protein IKG21_05710 [Atopobiaceae bacterium]|nr:hypothetical protein [Atopobiaceae bacterium]